jgi:hypothetical protein
MSYLRHLAKTGVLDLARTVATRNRQFALNYLCGAA